MSVLIPLLLKLLHHLLFRLGQKKKKVGLHSLSDMSEDRTLQAQMLKSLMAKEFLLGNQNIWFI